MNLETIEKKYFKALEVKEKLEKEIAEQTSAKEEKERLAEEAAGNGDISLYRQYKAEAGSIEESIFIKKAQLKRNGGTLKDSDISDFWKKYITGYSKKIKKELSEIEEARKELLSSLIKASETQNEALKIREKCGFFIGKEAPDPLTHDSSFSMFPIDPYINKDMAAYIVNYCTRCGSLHPVNDSDKLNLISSVVNMHAPYYNK